MSRDQLHEFWHGLVNSGQRFLWAAQKAKGCVGEGGSSCVELKRLVDDIRSIGTRECRSRHPKP
ncbi:hypothetical protein QJS10_CPB17g02126 [Acorus calamus]|uniref:Uncharacterized protein n=1 Tax=Acorus calamus TaxID=4465 RepID=A0AAV9CXW7_ACOCL|nr:hypothetical protein QJS10_CPB17g02126 [Acorus calamus]